MHMFDTGQSIHERYSGQNKWWIRRFASEKMPSIEFEAIDYTSKAIITESVLDAYRLMYNPKTQKVEFLNESEAEMAYYSKDRKKGWEKWANSKVTLRNMYRFNKKIGVAELRIGETVEFENKHYDILDLVRPKSNIGITSD